MSRNQEIYIPVSDEVDLWTIMRILLHKCCWLLLAGLAAGAGVYFIIHLFVTPTYESYVSFYVFNSTGGPSRSGTIQNGDLQAAEGLAATYSRILESNTILDAVLQDLGTGGALSRKELSRMVEISVIADTQLLKVAVSSADPRLACRIAESFARVVPTEILRITRAGGVAVVDPPEVATEKTAPHTVLDCAIGSLTGVMLASAVIVPKNLKNPALDQNGKSPDSERGS